MALLSVSSGDASATVNIHIALAIETQTEGDSGVTLRVQIPNDAVFYQRGQVKRAGGKHKPRRMC